MSTYISSAYTRIFLEIFKLIDIILAIPVGTATTERSFSEMKQNKTALRLELAMINGNRYRRS